MKQRSYVFRQAVELIRELGLHIHAEEPGFSSRSLLRVLHDAARDSNVEVGVRQFVRAEASFLSDRRELAGRLFQEIVGDATMPRRVVGLAWDRIGDLEWRAGRAERAARAYENALRFRPGDVRTQRDLVRARWPFGSPGTNQGVFERDVRGSVDCESVDRALRGQSRRGVSQVSGLYASDAGGGILTIQGRLNRSTQGLAVTGTLGVAAREACDLAWDLWQHRETAGGGVGARIHLPQGGIPKDGPSLGLAVYALIGGLFGVLPIRDDVALTGEVDLDGGVWPVGNVPQKVLAAYLAGFEQVILPLPNFSEVQESYGASLDLVPCRCVDELEELL